MHGKALLPPPPSRIKHMKLPLGLCSDAQAVVSPGSDRYRTLAAPPEAVSPCTNALFDLWICQGDPRSCFAKARHRCIPVKETSQYSETSETNSSLKAPVVKKQPVKEEPVLR